MATTADYLYNLITQKNALADNLTAKGVNATHDELLDTLVPKVLEISGQSGGGDFVKYALEEEAGYVLEDDPSTWNDTVKAKYMAYDYRLDYSGTIFVYGGRTVTRNTDKLAYCAYCTYNNGYFLPIIISTDPEAVAYTMGGSYTPGPNETVEIDGITIYANIAGVYSQRAHDSSDYNRRFFGEVGTPYGPDMIRKLYKEITMLGYSLFE